MYKLTVALVVVVSTLLSLTFVAAIPAFDGMTSWSSDIGNLVPGMSMLQALGPPQDPEAQIPFYLSVAAPRGECILLACEETSYSPLYPCAGLPGNATIYRNQSPPLYYIHQNQLWNYWNETRILRMNVHNSTKQAQLPLQMVLEEKPSGVPGGRWRWQGTMLFYENGVQNNQGLFYSCQNTEGLMGVYLFLQW